MGRILVIYGDEAVRQTLGKILELDSHCVTLAADGERGVAKLRQQNFDLVICDKQDSSSSLPPVCRGRPLILILESGGLPETSSEFETMRTIVQPFEGSELLILVRELIGFGAASRSERTPSAERTI